MKRLFIQYEVATMAPVENWTESATTASSQAPSVAAVFYPGEEAQL